MRLLKKISSWLLEREAAPAPIRGAPSSATDHTVEREAYARLVREAAEHRAAGRLAEAERVLIDALRERHDDAEALLLQGLVLKQQRRLEEAVDSFLLAAHFRPDFAEAHYQLGLIASSPGGSADAEQHYRRALGADPHHAKAYVALGALLVERESLDEAVDCFRKAVGIDPDYAQAHSNLGLLMAARLDRFAEAAPHLEKAWRLAPDDPDVMCNWAMYLQQRGELAESIALCDRLIEADATDPIPRLNRGLARLKMGDFSRGWVDYESRKQAGWPYVARTFPFPEWKGETLAGRKILVHAEQGLGDQLMFSSCIPDLMAMAKHCVIECAPKLEALFRRSFPAATVTSSAKTAGWESDEKLRGSDCYVAMGSLPFYFRKGRDAFPVHRGHLRADPQGTAAWRRRLADLPGKRKVGIAWRGGASSTRRSVRSVALDHWLPILRRADTSFVSLQYMDSREEIEQIGRDHGIQIHHWPEAIDDYDQTAALVSALDLVVSVDTTIVHLGGAFGKPVWVMVPAVAEWRYLQTGERLPWYPAVRVFRQTLPGEWGPVIERIASELDRLPVENVNGPDAGA
ncbi:MAG: tetratricopeptide repeat protein [Betaproteobacteria bacterium]|nr:tetratricopeptide repeat protein [Betaproteobacteria bacterium]MDH3436133.1 tetratricopeptide repeat protein [Betaproteobacteria bacterium]